MSKYRVLDDSKNKYDADELSSIVAEPTENGFTVVYDSTDDTLTAGIGHVYINTHYPNPLGQTISKPENTDWYICVGTNLNGTEEYGFTLHFINNTNLDLYIYNITIEEHAGVLGGSKTVNISPDRIYLPPNGETEISHTGSLYTFTSDYSGSVTLESFEVSRY